MPARCEMPVARANAASRRWALVVENDERSLGEMVADM
jgi:hypothetical protein